MTMTICYLIGFQDKDVGRMYSGYNYSSFNTIGEVDLVKRMIVHLATLNHNCHFVAQVDS